MSCNMKARSISSSTMRTRKPAARPTPPASAPACGWQPHDQQQPPGSVCGIDHRGDDAGAEMAAEGGREQIADERADDADQDIPDEAKAGPLDDLTRQPTGDET